MNMQVQVQVQVQVRVRVQIKKKGAKIKEGEKMTRLGKSHVFDEPRETPFTQISFRPPPHPISISSLFPVPFFTHTYPSPSPLLFLVPPRTLHLLLSLVSKYRERRVKHVLSKS
jgi:hypothetical protein